MGELRGARAEEREGALRRLAGGLLVAEGEAGGGLAEQALCAPAAGVAAREHEGSGRLLVSLRQKVRTRLREPRRSIVGAARGEAEDGGEHEPSGRHTRESSSREDLRGEGCWPQRARSGSGGAAFGEAFPKSSPRSAATVAASCDCVASTASRTPSAGVPGPITAIQIGSAAGTFWP